MATTSTASTMEWRVTVELGTAELPVERCVRICVRFLKVAEARRASRVAS